MTEEKKGFEDALTRMKKRAEEIAAKKKAEQEAKEAELRERANKLAVVTIDITRKRNERNLMLYPFCSTSKRKRLNPIKYQSADGSRYLEVTANHTYGMAKIWDFDILRYALSKAGEITRITEVFPESVEFSGYEVLKAIGRIPEGKNYRWLRDALARLCGTLYKGNIFPTPENERVSHTFTLISATWEDETGKLERISITFDKRLIESIRLNCGLLAINPDVLKEEAGIKKRLLELVQVSKGNKSDWSVGLERLASLCAHEGELKKFKRQLKNYVLPWDLSFTPILEGGEKATFSDK